MTTATCSNCGAEAKILKQDYRFKDLGLQVELKNIEVVQCPACGNVDPVIPDMEGLLGLLAAAVVCKPHKLNGSEVRFLRKFLGMNAREFARFLHVDHTHLSKVENEKTDIGTQLDKYLRLLAVNLSPALCKEVNRLLKLLPEIDDSQRMAPLEIQIDQTMNHFQYV